jgi:hypothetical protein
MILGWEVEAFPADSGAADPSITHPSFNVRPSHYQAVLAVHIQASPADPGLVDPGVTS